MKTLTLKMIFVFSFLFLLTGCEPSISAVTNFESSDEIIVNRMDYSKDGFCSCDVTQFPVTWPYGDAEITFTDAVLLEDCVNYEYNSALILIGDRSNLSDSDSHWLEKELFTCVSTIKYSDGSTGGSIVGKLFHDDNKLYFWIFVDHNQRLSLSDCEYGGYSISYKEGDIYYTFSFDFDFDSIKSPYDEDLDPNLLKLWNNLEKN